MIKHDMILYHFTSDLHLMGCRLKGLTKGVTPIEVLRVGVRFVANTQWLTSNPAFDQTWNRLSTLPYDRTANRLTICIPHDYIQNLRSWKDIGQKVTPSMYNWLSLLGDADHWYIYIGKIPPDWIVEAVKKPKP